MGEPATVIKTKSLSMLLGRQRPTALNGSKIEEGNVSFALPPVDELLHMHNESVTFLDSQVRSAKLDTSSSLMDCIY